MPGLGGGANWWGGVADPETGLGLHEFGDELPASLHYTPGSPPPANCRIGTFGPPDYSSGGGAQLPTVQGLRIIKPPYGRITAYDMNKGIIAWQIANGDTPAKVKSNPALQGLNIPKTGSPRQVGLMITKTLLFAGDGTDPLLHAYDKETGADLAQLPMPGMQTGLPMTYMHNGRQFILVSVGSANGQGPNWSLTHCRPKTRHPAAGALVDEADSDSRPGLETLCGHQVGERPTATRHAPAGRSITAPAAEHLTNNDGVMRISFQVPAVPLSSASATGQPSCKSSRTSSPHFRITSNH